MSKNTYVMIDEIKCYNPELYEDYQDYPSEGFGVTEKLEEKSFWCRSRNRLLKRFVLKFLEKGKTKRFLEIGCGTGFFLNYLSNEKNLQLTGSEVYLRGLKYAKNRLPHIEFIQFDAAVTCLPEKFDVIGAFDVVEHIENDAAAIKNIYDMLNHDGHFIITVPQYMFLWSAIDVLVKHKRRYSRKELLLKLREAGFDIAFQTSYLFTLFPVMFLSRMLDKKSSAIANEDEDFEKRVRLPAAVNWLFDQLMKVDECLIRLGISLPFGGSLLVVAHKA